VQGEDCRRWSWILGVATTEIHEEKFQYKVFSNLLLGKKRKIYLDIGKP